MGSIQFHCPHCEKAIESDEQYLGESVNCPYCNEEIIVAYDLDDIPYQNHAKRSQNKINLANNRTDVNGTHPVIKLRKEQVLSSPSSAITSGRPTVDNTHINDVFFSNVVLVTVVVILFLFVVFTVMSRKNSVDMAIYEPFKERIYSVLEASSLYDLYMRSYINSEQVINHAFKFETLKQAHQSFANEYKKFIESIPKEYSNNVQIKTAKEELRLALKEWGMALQLIHFNTIIEKDAPRTVLPEACFAQLRENTDPAEEHCSKARDSLEAFLRKQMRRY